MLVPDCDQIHSPALKKNKKNPETGTSEKNKKMGLGHTFSGVYI